MSGPVGQAPSRPKLPRKRLCVIATVFLLGLFGLVALKLWILAHMLMVYLS